MITNLVASFRKMQNDRRRYNKAMAEIESMNMRDLVDLGADRATLQRGVYREIYG